jgi:hypothetical protein
LLKISGVRGKAVEGRRSPRRGRENESCSWRGNFQRQRRDLFVAIKPKKKFSSVGAVSWKYIAPTELEIFHGWFYKDAAPTALSHAVAGVEQRRNQGTKFFRIGCLVAWLLKIFWRAGESGAEATAVQTLRDGHAFTNRAERLDCGAFTAAFACTWRKVNPKNFRPHVSGGVEQRSNQGTKFSRARCLVVKNLARGEKRC